MKQILFLFLFSFVVVLSSSAENTQEKSASQYCKDKGHKVGTLDFEFCCDLRKKEEKKEHDLRSKRILGRDKGGRFDKSRVKDEALDLKPRDPSDYEWYRPQQQ
ncbi:MAG: hypothetical protein HYX35_04210 [Proteobacteria bacterium]|nr:hypothetical protein [Pseudomonadota bacterium]